MSLKQMHILLISLSIGLAVALAAWAIRAYAEPAGTAWHLGLAALALVGGTTLCLYLAAFVRNAHRPGLL